MVAPEEQEVKLGVLNLYYDSCSAIGDNDAALAALEECLTIYRPISEKTAAERAGQPDGNMIFYLFQVSALLQKVGRIEESITAHNESYALIN